MANRLLLLGGGSAGAVGGGGGGGALDSYTTGLTVALSASRNLLSAFGGSQYTLASGKVSAWNDQSGNSRNMSQASASLQPIIETGAPNSRDAISFDGTDDMLESAVTPAVIIGASAGYIIASVVFDSVTDTNNVNIYDNDPIWADSGGYVGVHVKNGNLSSYNWDTAADLTTGIAIAAATAYVVEWRHESGTLYCRVNLGTEFSVASGTTQVQTGTFRLGQGRTGGGTNANVKIFEFASYITIPSASDRNAIATAFATWLGISLSGATSARYWRLLINTTGLPSTSTNIAEIQLREVAGGSDVTGSGTVSASGTGAGSPTDAFDNNASTTWHSTISDASPAWIQYDFGAGNDKAITEVVIQAHPSNAAYSPTDFDVQYSSDGSSWTTLWSVAGSTGWAAGETRTFTKQRQFMTSSAYLNSGATARQWMSADGYVSEGS